MLRCCVLVITICLTSNRADNTGNLLPPSVTSTFSSSHPNNNWAVLVATSRLWREYRSVNNVLSFYQSFKRLGVPDSQIIVMLSDDIACNGRNPKPGFMYNNDDENLNLYDEDIEVDYRGYEVSVRNFLGLLTGRHPRGTPRSKRLLTDHRSNVFIYMSGHAKFGFFGFGIGGSSLLSDWELADALMQMWAKHRYKELFFLVDSCKSQSMYQRFNSPHIIAQASSINEEDSYSLDLDRNLGNFLMDCYTQFATDFLRKHVEPKGNLTLLDFLESVPFEKCHSTAIYELENFERHPSMVPITDFFGSTRPYTVLRETGQNIQVDDTQWRSILAAGHVPSQTIQVTTDPYQRWPSAFHDVQ